MDFSPSIRPGRSHVVRSVFECDHFTEVLTDFFAGQAKSPTTTLGAWARRLGFASSGTLVNFMKGRATPSHELGARLANAMRLDREETEYFLLLLERARDTREVSPVRDGIDAQIRAFRKKANTVYLDLARFEPVSDPEHLIVREMTNLRDFREDAEWVSRRTGGRVAPERVTEIWKRLLDTGLLARDPSGRLLPTSPFQDTVRDTAGEPLKAYHERSIDLARASVRGVPLAERDVSTAVIGLAKCDFSEARAAIQNFRETFIAFFDRTDGSAEEVYHLNLQYFPVTKAPPDEG